VVAIYERHHRALQETSGVEMSVGETEAQGKECSNVLVLISELYNFQVISSLLVFDIIRGLLDKKLTEFGVELLLKIVRSTCILQHYVSSISDARAKTLGNNFVKMIPLRSRISFRLSKASFPRRTLC
jgi:hypothetical protein